MAVLGLVGGLEAEQPIERDRARGVGHPDTDMVYGLDLDHGTHTLSMTMAAPWPTPMHMVQRP